MKSEPAVSSAWTDALMEQRDPDNGSLREHLREVHRRDPGFTERCATKCVDEQGRTTYEWLSEAAQMPPAKRILDLACGSGFLLATCLKNCPDAEELIGVDMSPDELAIAQSRLDSAKIALHQGHAQDLGIIKSGSIDAVLCHWALTLMEPLDPVLEEIGRITRPGAVFSAIVDGDHSLAPQYDAIDELIFKQVSRVIPGYGDRDLGDPRVRSPEALRALCEDTFSDATVTVENAVFVMNGTPEMVAAEALGFYYAAFVLPVAERELLLSEITAHLACDAVDGTAIYTMPVCKLSVRF